MKFKEIEKTAVASTVHLTRDQNDTLSNYYQLGVVSVFYGYRINVTLFDCGQDFKSLSSLFDAAKKEGMTHVLFDCDGPVIDGFEEYDW